MDPNNPEPEEYGHDGDGHDGGGHGDGRASGRRPPRDSLINDLAQHTPAPARTVRLVTGDFLLTVNPVDGSEIENCPPQERPGPPAKYAAARRAEIERAARPPVPAGPALREPVLLQREEERERLVRLVARGRSVRLVGPAGSGRTVLLDAVARDCADLAPDGVVRLSGYRRTADDLMGDLFHAVYDAPGYRPGPDVLRAALARIGAVVVLDDLEFGGAALDELLEATPECAFLCAATPDVPAPSADARFEEVPLGGLDRAGGIELLERAVGRVLTEEESNWAGDLLFESEGLPLRFIQAGALLRQRERLRAEADAFDEFGVFEDAEADAVPDVPHEAGDGDDGPLPSLAEAAAPAPLLASRLSPSARETLKFAVALGGEVPHQTHLPALVDDTHADAALAELTGCALVTPVGSRYRLAAGVQEQLEAAGYDTGAEAHALSAAQHYAWWAGHPSVTPERVSAEADAVLAALTALLPLTEPVDEEEESPAAIRLARQAAPAFAAGLHWGAWERALRAGAEASLLAGEVADQAYFHHELGVLALCEDQPARARTELETSIGLRGALADKRGTVAGRRALALVDDRAGTTAGAAAEAGTEAARPEEPVPPAAGTPVTAFGAPAPTGETGTLVTHRAVAALPPGGRGTGTGAAGTGAAGAGTAGAARKGGFKGLVNGARRNLVAVGTGALLVALLGTVVTLGATSDNHNENAPSEKIGVNPSASRGSGSDSPGTDRAKKDDGGDDGSGTAAVPTDPGPDGAYGTSDDPTPSDSARPSSTPSGEDGGDDDGASASPSKPSTPSKTSKPTPSKSASSSRSPSGSPSSESPSSPDTTPPTTPSNGVDSPEMSGSARVTSGAPETAESGDGTSATGPVI